MLARGTEFGECTSSSCQATKDQDIRRKSWIMKRNSKQFLALFMAVAMSVTPVSYAYAEDSAVAGVENTDRERTRIRRVRKSRKQKKMRQQGM